MKQKLSAYRQNFEDYCQKNKKYAPVAFFIVFILALYIFSKIQDNERHIYHHKSQIDLKGGRILGNNRVIYQRKERVLSNKIKLLERTNKEFKDQIERINGLLLENKDKSVQDSAPEPLPEKIGQEDRKSVV